MRHILYVLIACLFLSFTACSRKDTANKSAGATEKNPAPDVSVISMASGSTLNLSDLKGKVVMLNFWATWCPPCREEIPSMMKLNSLMVGKPFQMVAVSVDEGGKPAIESFFKESGFLLPTYLDNSGAAAKSYGVTGIPETFIIDKQGVIVKKIIGGFAWDSPEAVSFLEELMK
ncbi:MAG: TlpA disulfide reductase family protein [Desulfuromonadaceae bacterium]|nr:TlpA disulfide reductase family protein [Desulfuromonadaceae bacterium]MDD2846938.1 TlpA disulfide reductase family protein [Desulfuromonadaceae bacterium]MDD4129084.1 TlpA disulfide reductase family protein [Desulfuromonadaceae bacterium]